MPGYFLGDYVGLTATEHDFLAFFAQPHDTDPGSIFFSRIAPACVGDCDGDNKVTVNELVTGVNIALDRAQVSRCQSFDSDGNGNVAINELVAAVNNALHDLCGDR